MCCPSFIPRSSYYLVSLQLIHGEWAQSDRAQLSWSGCMFLFESVIRDNFAQAAQSLNFKVLQACLVELTAGKENHSLSRVTPSLPSPPPAATATATTEEGSDSSRFPLAAWVLHQMDAKVG